MVKPYSLGNETYQIFFFCDLVQRFSKKIPLIFRKPMFHCYAGLPLRVPIENLTSRSGTIGTPSPLNHIAGLCLGGEAPLGRWFLEMGWDWWDLDLWLLWWDGQIIEMNHTQEWGLPSDNKLAEAARARLAHAQNSCKTQTFFPHTQHYYWQKLHMLSEAPTLATSNISPLRTNCGYHWISVWHDVAIFFCEKQCLEYPHPDL